MPWIVLVLSGLCEAVWATALGASHGFSEPVPTIVFFVFCVVSMLGLGWAVKQIPIGTAYAVWTGIGAALTVTWAMVTGAEAVSVWKVVFLVGVIAAVVGLKLVPSSSAESEAESAAESEDGFAAASVAGSTAPSAAGSAAGSTAETAAKPQSERAAGSAGGDAHPGASADDDARRRDA